VDDMTPLLSLSKTLQQQSKKFDSSSRYWGFSVIGIPRKMDLEQTKAIYLNAIREKG
jgi:hypothetical protein